MKLAIGTRFWGVDQAKDFPRILAFVEAAKGIGQVFVAVNSDKDKIDTVSLFPDVAFSVTPWGKFVQPLNAIILKAAIAGASHLLLASAEFPPTQEQVDALFQYMSENTLVVGARFAEHEFVGGMTVCGTGTTVPWNTFALWNLKHLSLLGFPLVGDAPFDPKMAGVEEVAAISIYQKVWGYNLMAAVLVKIPGIGGEWNMDGWSEERLAAHRKKIQSKKDRPATQLKHMNIMLEEDIPYTSFIGHIEVRAQSASDDDYTVCGGHEWRDLTVTQKRHFKRTGRI